jgi:drug/metabolite transporter (DMT)-like permease
LGGNGAVVWAERRVSSAFAALLIASMPFWIVLLEWLGPIRRAPRRQVIGGLVVGVLGITLLIGDPMGVPSATSTVGGAIALLGGSLSWAAGSIYSRSSRMPNGFGPPAVQMLTGGTFLIGLSYVTNEASGFSLSQVSAVSFVSWAYLVTMRSLIGFTAYIVVATL